jgi:anti-anti-sigma factor
MSHDTHPPVASRETVHKYLTIRQSAQRHDLERVQPVGEIDLCTAPVLRDVLADVESRAVPTVLVDLSEVDFLALVGVQVLQSAAERSRAASRRMLVVAPTPMVQRVLSLTDQDAGLETYVTLPSALAALSAPPSIPIQASVPAPVT